MVATRLFTWMQDREFYHGLQAEAVSMLPRAHGTQQWIDVGCGPGLVARLAAARGYHALGIDINPQMVAAAQQTAKREGSTASFRVGSLEEVSNATADVISAASLLAVLDDPMAGLIDLWRGIRPGGTLLVIEPTAEMTVKRAQQLLGNELSTTRNFGLYLWANARQGHAIDPTIYSRVGATRIDYAPLLYGLVGAWFLRKR